MLLEDIATEVDCPLGRVAATGFREYDARWMLYQDIDLPGIRRVGLAFATLARERDAGRRVVVGHDYRSYSEAVKAALIDGLVEGGMTVLDIGLALSPVAYFAQFHLDAPCVAMVTASHNDNGWTGLKMGLSPPVTLGPEEMAHLKTLVLDDLARPASGGSMQRVMGVQAAYAEALTGGRCLTRPLKVVCACGNGTAGAFAPDVLRAVGCEVVELDCDLDWTFPNYNPNPEDSAMLEAMGRAVRESGADLAVGFDGDGDRCGVVDENGRVVLADRMGLVLARDMAARHPGATFVVDVKTTGLFATDPVLAAHGARVVYWKTGHSHIKRKVAETGALAGFEKSGHMFLAGPLGRGYDDGLAAALAVLDLLDRRAGLTLGQLAAEPAPAFTSLTLSPHCPDELKYGVEARVTAEYLAMAAAGATVLGRRIVDVLTVNGVRVHMDDGGWLLVRASSNKPELVVVVESLTSDADMRALFEEEVRPRLARYPEVGAYNQTI